MNATTSSRALRALAAIALVSLCACSDDTSGGGGGDDTNNDLRARNNGGGGGGGGGGGDAGDGGGDDAGGGGGGGEDAGGGGGDDGGVVIEVDAGCTPGEVLGCFDANSELVCDATGGSYTDRSCPGEQLCLQGACTDMICIPGTSSCADTESQQICNAAGDGYEPATPCAEGSVCSDDTCKSICELGKYRSSYIGCEYTTIDLDQYTDPGTNPKPDEIPHSVVISNPNTQPVTVSFRSNAVGVSVNVPDPVVPAGGVKAFTMPRLDVTGTGITRNSISVSATLPVVAHQFSPLNNQGVFSNDASLLLPRNTLGDEYYTLGWPTQPIGQACPPNLPFPCPEDQHAYVTIVATEPGQTALLVIPAAPLKAGGGIGNIPKGISRSFTLSQGEVLNLEAGPMGLTDDKDLSGTYIKATQPVAVFAGHEEAVIGEPGSDMDSCCADHLQQQMFPLKDWGQTYVAALSPSRGTKKDHWKILAGADGVTVTTNPPQPGAGSSTLNKGEFVEFFSDQDFEIDANGPILVGQFLVSQQQTTSVTGDPAFLLAVPTEKFRKDYVLLTPDGYNEDFVGIIRPAGAPIELDGQVVSDANFRAIGAGTWEVGYFPVQPGQHTLEANVEFGIAAYGFDTAVSYGYPGGLNLIGDEQANP
jgi:hypothetical protein